MNGYINPIERDNIAVGLYYNGRTLESVKVVPLAGRNRQIRFQPFVLTGKQAVGFLGLIRSLCRGLNTDMDIMGGYGYIDVTQKNASYSRGSISPSPKPRRARNLPHAGPSLKTGSK